MSAAVEAVARQVYARVVRGRPWLGLIVDDVIGEAYVQAADGKQGASLYWALRRYVYRWLDGDADAGVAVIPFPIGFDAPQTTPEAPATTVDASDLLARLSTDRRAIIGAIYGDGMSPQEAAAALNVPVSRVHKQRYRAVEQLRAWAGRPSAAYLTERARSLAALTTLHARSA
jgi:DNA-directed RNA polymerase specialized sigma24 family protein